LTQAIKMNPKYTGAYLMRGAIYFDTKRYDLAKTDLTKVIELSPGNKLATDTLARITLLATP
ncbi:MAG: tetratricopeptide repeat protein, partial [Acidobacteria bacterium]|nr:tetratricopeptide repeat protein [Acidobacteriota bacterium]